MTATVTNECSRCGGHGLVHGMLGDPTDCPDCGCAGVVWPPRCERCGRFGRNGEQCRSCAVREQEA